MLLSSAQVFTSMTAAELSFRRELLARGLKLCPRCGRILPLLMFHQRRECRLDGRQTYCIRCRKARQVLLN